MTPQLLRATTSLAYMLRFKVKADIIFSMNPVTANVAADPTPRFTFDDQDRWVRQNSTGFAACERIW